MSAASGPVYWCHQCNRQTRLQSGEDVVCMYCNGGFIEEMESTEVEHGMGFSSLPVHLTSLFGFPFPFLGDTGSRGSSTLETNEIPDIQRHRPRLIHGHHPGFSELLGTMTNVVQQRDIDPSSVEVPGARILILQGEAPNFFGSFGNLDVFIDHGFGAGPRLLPGHFGDFFLGPELDHLIQLLAENDPNRYGPPPASKVAVEAMPTVEITEEHMRTEVLQCAVCKDDFEIGTSVKQMSCKHMYHPDCILPWLSQHNTCPVCRYEMPADDTGVSKDMGGSSVSGSRDEAGVSNRANAIPVPTERNNRQARLRRQFTLVGMPGHRIYSNGNENETSSGNEEARLSSPAPAQDPTEERSVAESSGFRLPISIPWLFRLFSSSSPRSVESNHGTEAGSANNVSSTSAVNGSQQPPETEGDLSEVKNGELH